MVFPHQIVHVRTPGTCERDLLWGKVIADVKAPTMGSSCNHRVLMGKREGDLRQTHRGGGHGAVEAEIGAMQPQAKERRCPRGWQPRERLSPRLQRDHGSETPDSRLLASRTARE